MMMAIIIIGLEYYYMVVSLSFLSVPLADWRAEIWAICSSRSRPGGNKNHWRICSRDEPKYMEFGRLCLEAGLERGGIINGEKLDWL